MRSGADARLKAISRTEFLVALVRLATSAHMRSGAEDDVASALRRLFRSMEGTIHARLIAPPDQFRAEYAYTQEVDAVLRQNEKAVRALFNGLAAVSPLARGEMVDFLVWMAFLHELELISSDLTERHATLAFAWSRMLVVDASSARGRLRESHLPFEGFCEALCHVAVLKALPSDSAIAEAEGLAVRHAGAYLFDLRENDVSDYQWLMRYRASGWGEEPKEPLDRLVAHTLALIIYTIAERLRRRAGGKGAAAARSPSSGPGSARTPRPPRSPRAGGAPSLEVPTLSPAQMAHFMASCRIGEVMMRKVASVKM